MAAGKKILLTLNKDLYDVIKMQADGRFMSIQEFISDMLRNLAVELMSKNKGTVAKKRA